MELVKVVVHCISYRLSTQIYFYFLLQDRGNLQIRQHRCPGVIINISQPSKNWMLLTIHGKVSPAQQQSLWKMRVCKKLNWHFLRARSHAFWLPLSLTLKYTLIDRSNAIYLSNPHTFHREACFMVYICSSVFSQSPWAEQRTQGQCSAKSAHLLFSSLRVISCSC